MFVFLVDIVFIMTGGDDDETEHVKFKLGMLPLLLSFLYACVCLYDNLINIRCLLYLILTTFYISFNIHLLTILSNFQFYTTFPSSRRRLRFGMRRNCCI